MVKARSTRGWVALGSYEPQSEDKALCSRGSVATGSRLRTVIVIVSMLAISYLLIFFHTDTKTRVHAATELTIWETAVDDNVLSVMEAAIDMRTDNATMSAWRAAQSDMFDRTKPMRTWQHRENSARNPREWANIGFPVADEVFFEYFTERFHNEPDFFLEWVYIPLPWRFIREDLPRRSHTTNVTTSWHRLLNATGHLLENLDPGFTYFTVMEQSHEKQFANLLYFDNARWDKIVAFDSRGDENPSRGDIGKHPIVPIPLLKARVVRQSLEPRKEQVFFAGSCHHQKLRSAFGPNSTVSPGPIPGGRYMWDIRACDDKVTHKEFSKTLQESTWIITPRGVFPPTFMTYETLQAGSLPLIPFSNWSAPVEPQLWLPYQDIGVRWDEFALFIHESKLPSLKQTVEAIPARDVKRRLAIVRKWRPLFTPEGLNIYVIYTVSRLRRERRNKSTWMEMYRAGRSSHIDDEEPQLLDSCLKKKIHR